MNEQSMLNAFSIISDAGDASSKFLSALKESEKYNFDESTEFIKKGNEALVNAHQKQTTLLQEETRGVSTEITLLMVHAQDHLMNAMLLKDVVESFEKVNKKLSELEKRV